MRLVIGALLLYVFTGWLTGCATVPTEPEVRTVSVPCVRSTDIPVRPTLFSEQAWESPDVFTRLKALKADRVRLLAHADKLEATLRACVE